MLFDKEARLRGARAPEHPPVPPDDAAPSRPASSVLDPYGPFQPTDESNQEAQRKESEVGERILEYVRAVTDNRMVSMVMLFWLLVAIVGVDNILLFLIILFVGYAIADRFVQARRALVVGGAGWLLVLGIGIVMTATAAGPLIFDVDTFLTVCGFVFGVALYLLFFAAGLMFRAGYRRGQQRADEAIAEHMIDRLVDDPQGYGALDGDYLASEAAIGRVREQQHLAEQAVRDEARRKDDLVTYLAHDLKTPLASIVGYLSLLEEAPDLPVEQRARFTRIALDKAHRLDSLIEEFFDITRFDFNDIVLTRGRINLGLMLGQVVDEFYPLLAEQHKDVEVSVPGDIEVVVDGDKMARVFNNVLKNALAYSYEHSTIRIAAERRDGTVRVTFENQGDPIPEAKRKVIFEKFYRLDAARATNRGGAGLGLAIAKEIVTAHGGTIACDSDPDRTVFTITLPAA